MYLNLVPLYSILAKENQKVINEDLVFIDEINNFLMDEDLIIAKNAKDSLFDIILIGSGGTEGIFLKHLDEYTPKMEFFWSLFPHPTASFSSKRMG